MTPEERQLVTGLFDRMRSYGALNKDREAEDVIIQSVRAMPDAPYMLVQSVLAQEHALQQAGKRIEELEAQVRSLESEGQRAPAASGTFLGGLFGGARPGAQAPTSVPPIGARAAPSGAGDRPAWGGQPPPQQPAPAAGGGFLQSAMATAAGVAGGMLAAGAIRNMLGGQTPGSAATTAQQTPPAAEAQQAKAEQPQSEDASVQDAAYDEDDSDWGGDDLGDMDV